MGGTKRGLPFSFEKRDQILTRSRDKKSKRSLQDTKSFGAASKTQSKRKTSSGVSKVKKPNSKLKESLS